MDSIKALALAKAVGGGQSVTVEPLSVTANGDYTAETGKAYSPVSVAVPNSYTAGDEGKVVSDGALVSQTSTTKNSNGTYDTTLNNEVVVDVPNSYSAGDEGKVVSNGALVAQTAHAEVTENGTIDTTLNNSVTVNVSGGGGGSVAASDVNFYDYDGSIVAAYTAEDFANLTALPSNPDRTSEGLTAQGWNWSLSDAKTYVASYGRLNIGQMYITTDGKTHVHIHLEQGRTSPMLGVCPNGAVDVDWGDGTAHDTLTGFSTAIVQWTNNHNYAAPGDYVIKLTVSEGGSMSFYNGASTGEACGLLRYSSSNDTRNIAYLNSITEVFIGSGVTGFNYYAFSKCYSLSIITIPSSVTNIGNNAFYSCYSLTSITIPSSVTRISTYTFYSCYSLSIITIPSGVTDIDTYAFYSCTSLSNITIPSSATSIGNNAFYSCYSLTSITIPSSVTSVGDSTFRNCTSLSNITIPSSATTIGGNAFNNCTSLSNITIPSSVTSIGASAFYYCYGPAELHFLPSSPPTVSNSNAFTGIPTDCKIYVPYSADHSILSAYTSANNYPSSSTYTYVEE